VNVTHFEILRSTVPDVDCLEEGIVAIVKGAAIHIELVGKLPPLAKITLNRYHDILLDSVSAP
jgi:hypothetical protein